jgi:hypothetical protein
MLTTSGLPRGRCTKPKGHERRGHNGAHNNDLCSNCGKLPQSYITLCRLCYNKRDTLRRRKEGVQPMNTQTLGNFHKFRCGCEGVLPLKVGEHNKFVAPTNEHFICRISGIVTASESTAKEYKDKPINRDIPHSAIRLLMEEKNCELCGLPLTWEFAPGKTPHLHHNHATGKLFGFVHAKCNPHALEAEIERQRIEIERLKKKLDKIRKS